MPLCPDSDNNHFDDLCSGATTTSPSSPSSEKSVVDAPSMASMNDPMFEEGSAAMSTTSSSSSDSSPSLARSRWGILQNAILKKTIPEPVGNPASKRIFERYSELVSWKNDISKSVMNVQVKVPYRNVLSTEFANPPALKATNMNLDYICTSLYPIQIHRKDNVIPVDIRNLKGFDKTGRICIWPSEQILTYWSLRNRHLFDGKRVLEIGGGFHCLAGLALAKYSKAAEVVLTDGDDVNVEEVSYSIERNNVPADTCRATTLLWGKFGWKPEFEGYFDFVVAADVVYESSIFDSLLETLAYVLKPGGQFILFNPTRDGMLQKFVRLAQNSNAFTNVKLIENYDTLVIDITWDLMQTNPAFNRDWHYPIQVAFKKVANYTISPDPTN